MGHHAHIVHLAYFSLLLEKQDLVIDLLLILLHRYQFFLQVCLFLYSFNTELLCQEFAKFEILICNLHSLSSLVFVIIKWCCSILRWDHIIEINMIIWIHKIRCEC